MTKAFSTRSNARYAAKLAVAKGAAARTKRAVAPAKVKAECKAAQRAPVAEVAAKPVAEGPNLGGVPSK